jgi:hypothetical protein
MSEQNELDPFLTPDETQTLTRISTADAPYNQRAQALLALHQGQTLDEAAELTGLRTKQVAYWHNRYQKTRLAVFPAELLVEPAPTAAEVLPEAEVKETPTAVSPEDKKKKSKEGKAKKEKKDKKGKKAGKDKKKNKKEKKGDKDKKKNKKAKPKKE